MNKIYTLTGALVPDPLKYLTYLFLRHPGILSDEVSTPVQLLDTYEFIFGSQGQAILGGEKPQVVRPPQVFQGEELKESEKGVYKKWLLSPQWRGTVSRRDIVFQGAEEPLTAQLIKFNGVYYFHFEKGLDTSSPLAKNLIQDQWKVITSLWYRDFLKEKNPSGFLEPVSQGLNVKNPAFQTAVMEEFRKILHRARLYETGILAAKETEPLHQFRVLIRKARSILTLAAEYLPEAFYQEVKVLLGDLHRNTNQLRDLDVQKDDWPPLGLLLESQGGDAAPFLNRLEKDWRREIRRLRYYMRSQEYHDIWKKIEELLETPFEDGISFKEGCELIWIRGSKRLKKRIQTLAHEDHDNAVHGVRIGVKNLRYIQEFFPLTRKGDRNTSSPMNLPGLQDQLGAFQDACVRLNRLNELRNDKEFLNITQNFSFGFLLGHLDGQRAEIKKQLINQLRGGR